MSAAVAAASAVAEDFQSLPALCLGNGRIRAHVLTTAGPRVVRLFAEGVEGNLLAEMPKMTTPTPWGGYAFRGGHRLWHAPEAFPRTYVPDDAGLTVREEKTGVVLVGAVEAPTGLRKSIEMAVDPVEHRLTLTHVVKNEGLFPVEVAAWALTMLPLGGVALVPTAAPEVTEFTPNRALTMWPYARWDDARLGLTPRGILVRADASRPPLKLGTFVHAGWAAYLRDGVLFVKRFTPRPDRPHADRSSNVEVYVADAFLELETLGPLERLEPGAETRHVETWEVLTRVTAAPRFEEIEELLARGTARC
jgi:hypothetical protein